jgi:hypothetical protein
MMCVAVMGNPDAKPTARTMRCFSAGILPTRFHAATLEAGSLNARAMGLIPPKSSKIVLLVSINGLVQKSYTKINTLFTRTMCKFFAWMFA